jgi:hypothetical protein
VFPSENSHYENSSRRIVLTFVILSNGRHFYFMTSDADVALSGHVPSQYSTCVAAMYSHRSVGAEEEEGEGWPERTSPF